VGENNHHCQEILGSQPPKYRFGGLPPEFPQPHSCVTQKMAKKDIPMYTGSPRMHMGTPHLHTGIGPKKIAYGDSPFANGSCLHKVLNIYACTA
jgi:hypothetical protein